MRYRHLGSTGLTVSALCLGTVYFGSFVPADEAIRIVHRALDLGVSFVDTAEIYMRPSYNASEEVVGRALAGRRSEVILATKKRYDPRQFRTGGPSDHGMARRQIVAAIEGSLRRLRTDYLDLYYSHQPDPETPLDEMLDAFDDLVRAGKVRYVGLSNYPAWRVVEALWLGEKRGWAPVAGVQTLYNLLDRGIEREIVPACQRFGLGLVTYSPLAGGVLTGKYGDSPNRLPPDSRAARVGQSPRGRPGHIPVLSARNLAVARQLSEFAEARRETAARLAIAWTLHQPAVSSVILGASTVGQLEANVAAAELDLGRPDLDALSALASEQPALAS